MSMKQINKNTRRAKIYKRYLIVSIIIGSIMVFVTGKEYIEKNIPKELTILQKITIVELIMSMM